MRAVQLHGVGDLREAQLPDPQPAAGEVLLKVRAVGVCGSDLHHYLEGAIGSTVAGKPFVLGHEFAGEVVEGGDLPPGTLVAVDPNRSCGHCEWCRAGHPNLCPNVEFAGVPPYPGALAEYITARPEELIPVPEGFSAADAALLEPLGVAIHALDLARLRPFESVAVVGLGPIGLLLVQVARLAGAGELIAVDPVEYRREIATNIGADHAVADAVGVMERTGGRGVDVVLEATDSPDGPQTAADAVRIGGRLVLVGIPEGDSFAFNASTVRRKGLTIKMSRRMGEVYPRAVEMVRRNRIDLGPIATHRFPLERTAEAFELQAERRDGVIKSVIYPWEE